MIQEFRGEHAFLSNFWPFQGKQMIGPPAPIRWKGILYPTAEHLYQVAKATTDAARTAILAEPTPGDAKKAGRFIVLRPDWEQIKRDIMLRIVTAKFAQNPDLLQKLFETGTEELVEGNWWGDVFWGRDLKINYGENWLGRILMLVRDDVFRNPNACQLIDRIYAGGRLSTKCELYFEELAA